MTNKSVMTIFLSIKYLSVCLSVVDEVDYGKFKLERVQMDFNHDKHWHNPLLNVHLVYVQKNVNSSNAETCLYKPCRPVEFFSIEFIINVLVLSSFRFIWIPMLWVVYGHYKYLNCFSVETFFIRQNLTLTELRVYCHYKIVILLVRGPNFRRQNLTSMSVPALKGLRMFIVHYCIPIDIMHWAMRERYWRELCGVFPRTWYSYLNEDDLCVSRGDGKVTRGKVECFGSSRRQLRRWTPPGSTG